MQPAGYYYHKVVCSELELLAGFARAVAFTSQAFPGIYLLEFAHT